MPYGSSFLQLTVLAGHIEHGMWHGFCTQTRALEIRTVSCLCFAIGYFFLTGKPTRVWRDVASTGTSVQLKLNWRDAARHQPRRREL